MSYGSAMMRTYYGAGDYNRALAMTGGYYAAGGFFSGLKKLASKAMSANLAPLTKVAGGMLGGIGGKLLKGVPVLGTALTAFDIGKDLYKSFSGGQGTKSALSIGKLANMTARSPGAALAGAAGGLAVERRRRRPSKRRSSSSRSRRRAAPRRRSRYARGDWGDDGGRDKRGHYLNERGGHRNLRRRRKRRRGGRVSFTTKDGRRVSFTSRGDA